MNFKPFLFLGLILSFTSCKIGRFVAYNFADIKDYKKFPNREIQNTSDEVFKFPISDQSIDLNKVEANFDEFVTDHKSVAFLVIHNDSIKYEKYYNKYDEASIVTSFSMAKSMTSMLIGCAIEDQLIGSIKEPITKYIPELSENGFDKVTIEHLLQMTSGLDFNESYYNPLGHAASFYYGRNLKKEIAKLDLKAEPEAGFEYVSGSTQLLGLILDVALKGKTISKYFEEKIWTPLEMEYDATWSIDKKKEGLEKTFCCVNARARDFAKLGRLYLNKGNWNGKQVIPADWVEQSTKVDSLNGSVNFYQHQWWIPNATGDFMMQGILGQFVFVSPEKNLIIVRLGKKYGNTSWSKLFGKIRKQF